jgi:mono/diheme cytochrome c family protein
MSAITRNILLLMFMVQVVSCSSGTDSGKVFVPTQGHPAQWASHLSVGSTDFHGTVVTSVPPDQVAGSGAVLFVKHCEPCHGNAATGKVGPNIRIILASATDIPATITSTIKAVPLMQGQAVLSPAEIGDISAYLSTLIGGAAPVPGVRETDLCSQCHGVNLDGGIAKISCFACHKGPDGSIGHPDGWLSSTDNPTVFHGAYGRDFSTGCTACHGADLKGGVVFASATGLAPACSSCHNGVIAPIL